jgi:hypothetical protein
MSTVHLEPSRKWLRAVEDKITELEKLAGEWNAEEAKKWEEAKRYDTELIDEHTKKCEEYTKAVVEYAALSWWQRRGKLPPNYPIYPLRWWYTKQQFPMASMVAALHSLVAPARRNLPLDVDAEIAALFIK